MISPLAAGVKLVIKFANSLGSLRLENSSYGRVLSYNNLSDEVNLRLKCLCYCTGSVASADSSNEVFL